MKMTSFVKCYVLPVVYSVCLGIIGYRFSDVRYALALLLLICIPPAFAFWFVVHPFIAFWRRVGVAVTYVSTLALLMVMGIGLFFIGTPLLRVDWGADLGLIALGVPIVAISMYISARWRQVLRIRTLFGLPELNPGKHPGKLLTEGIFAKIRHPRYMEVAIGLAGWSLILNYPAVYGLVLFSWIVIYVTVVLEERELLQRWGDEYRHYRDRVPRFIPKIHK